MVIFLKNTGETIFKIRYHSKISRDQEVRRWIKDRSPDINHASVSTVKLQAELKRVKRENERLRMEREILKKAAAFFAKESA